MLDTIKHWHSKLSQCFLVLISINVFDAVAQSQDIYTADGIMMQTALDINGIPEQAVLVMAVTLPDEDSLILPFTFTGNPEVVTLHAYFNNNEIDVESGILEQSNNIDYMILDISSVKMQFGNLKLVLNTGGNDVAELFLIESVNYTDADVEKELGDTNTGAHTGSSGGSVSIYLIFILILGSIVEKLHVRRSASKLKSSSKT
ncbi:hypothetical protein GCM10009092_18990 [Bowmanella denitrificans]|uniref:GlyGly-CTERM sorting domain-containing protein n=1 Tax=Bowmanella denitrificans TaxID=366582 RepID=A0ABN0X4M0_9ALTE